jgi:hypothetical protein
MTFTLFPAWPQPANFLAINRLLGLTSLRLSLGIAVDSNPIPWVVFLLTNFGQIRLQHLTIDLRFDENRDTIHPLPWAELDSALCEPSLAGVHTLVTLFLYRSPNRARRARSVMRSILGEGVTVPWLAGEITRLLPCAGARDSFEVQELSRFTSLDKFSSPSADFCPSRFFYWPGPLVWRNSEY